MAALEELLVASALTGRDASRGQIEGLHRGAGCSCQRHERSLVEQPELLVPVSRDCSDLDLEVSFSGALTAELPDHIFA